MLLYSLGIEVIDCEIVKEFLYQFIVLHGLVNQFLIFLQRVGNGLHPLAHFG